MMSSIQEIQNSLLYAIIEGGRESVNTIVQNAITGRKCAWFSR
jgi:hypothetical protein